MQDVSANATELGWIMQEDGDEAFLVSIPCDCMPDVRCYSVGNQSGQLVLSVHLDDQWGMLKPLCGDSRQGSLDDNCMCHTATRLSLSCMLS